MEMQKYFRFNLTLMKAGQVYKQFRAQNGKLVTLRSIRWEDLTDCVEFANSLVDERNVNPGIGIILDKRQTIETESEWLARKLASIELGQQISVVSIVDGKLVGNSEVMRGISSDEYNHGKLGISIMKDYRDMGIGSEMLQTLVEESRKAELMTIELEVFATNLRAIHLYETVGFKQVGRIPRKIFRGGRYTDIIIMSLEL